MTARLQSQTPDAAAILAWYRPDADAYADAARWYSDAGRTARRLARAHHSTPARAAGVIAALSPLQPWAGNVVAAERILAAAAAGSARPPAVGLRRNVGKAWAIACGARPVDILRGPKVRAFYRNILGDLSAVTVDRWAARAAGVSDAYPSTPARYAACARAYVDAAAIAGVPPAVLQAIVWVAIRGRAD